MSQSLLPYYDSRHRSLITDNTNQQYGYPALVELQFSAVNASTHRRTSWEPNEDIGWVETYHVDGWAGRSWTLTADATGPVMILVPELSTGFERYEYEVYAEQWRDDTAPGEPMPITEWNKLFAVKPREYGAIGPQMSFWYDCPVVEDDPHQAAVILDGLGLCVVEVDGSWGLALTGGGMDMTWDIIAAYVRLGCVPPTHFAKGLKDVVSSVELTNAHRVLIDASVLSLDIGSDWLMRARGWLLEQVADTQAQP